MTIAIRVHQWQRRWTSMISWDCCKYTHSSSRPEKGDRPFVYDYSFVERQWYDWWENNGQFQLRPDAKLKPFSMCLPPPNVTGDLHIGHALTVAVEDVLLRWRRMNGDPVVWIPGFDHAGIATQVVVEKQLMREKGLRRIDMRREDFINGCFRWKERKMETIQSQLKRLGASLDWSRTYYTMDENFSNAVTEAFLRLYKRGLVFRGERLVNWCPFLKSTLSDMEVERKTFDCSTGHGASVNLPGRTKPIQVGRLFYIDYPLMDDNNQYLTVATTRPETIFADVALAVNPKDERYGRYIGKLVKNPIADVPTPIAIIADSHVDPNFGTGVLKVTPAHDWTDYEISRGHPDLPLNVRCLTEDGKLNESCGKLCGHDRFEARDLVVDSLSSRGLLRDVKIQQQVTLPLCSRTGDVVEPMLKEQWFVDCRNMAAGALRALDEGKLNITPKFYEAQWRHWLGLTGDWCISRQLWWGHRIPAYRLCHTDDWYCARDSLEAVTLANRDHPDKELGVTDLEQDEDVLDTWFSSALVPLVAAGWPRNSKLDALCPLSLMETGHDILSFWVTRMAMMGLELTGQLPFDDILLHGIVFDKHGRKMSKSLGNVVDPLDIIDGVQLETLKTRLDASSLPISEIKLAKEAMEKEFPEGVLACGADALRFMLLKQDIKFVHQNLDVNIILSGRKFCNKLWQAFNYMENSWNICSDNGWICDGYQERIIQNLQQLPVVDQWLLSRLARLLDVINRSLGTYDFHTATNELYSFAWFELCDFYLEWTKAFLRPTNPLDESTDTSEKRIIGDVLLLVADIYTRCLAPFMPFLSEELYGRIIDIQKKYSSTGVDLSSSSIHSCTFPNADSLPFSNDQLEQQMITCRKIIEAIRSVRKEFDLSARSQLSCIYFGTDIYLEAPKTFEQFLSLVWKVVPKAGDNYRPVDAATSDLKSGHIWKSIDENLLLAIELQQADQERVIQRLAAQIERLKKRKDEHENHCQRTERQLAEIATSRSRIKPEKLERQLIYLKEKICNIQIEINRLESMYNNCRKSDTCL